MTIQFNPKAVAALTLLACLTFALPATAQEPVPSVVPYQGYLTLGNGTPVNNTVSLTFRLYSDADDPNPVWTETHEDVEVSNGAFYVYLGMEEDGIAEHFGDGENNYLSVEVDEDGEASPIQNIGSVPFALLAGNAQQLGGNGPDYYVSQDDIANFITQADLDAALNNYVTETELNQAIANFITQTDLDTALENVLVEGDLVNYVTITALDNRNYVTLDQLNEAIDNVEVDLTNYITVTQLNVALGNYTLETQHDTDIQNLQDQIDGLSNDVANLTTVVNNIQVNGGGGVNGFILGLSGNVASAITVDGQTGLRGADQACRNAYNGEPTAHFCSEVEVQRALASQNFTQNLKNQVHGVQTYTIGSSVFHGFAGNNENASAPHTCWNLLYGSGHIGRSTLLRVFFDTPIDRGQTGHYYDLTPGQSCNNGARPLLCCR
jgi:hypothetical protein